jgi:hypothetical protein
MISWLSWFYLEDSNISLEPMDGPSTSTAHGGGQQFLRNRGDQVHV